MSLGECTGTSLHIEDAGLFSVNLVLGGDLKMWLIIPPSSQEALESRIREEFPADYTCSQQVRHRSVLIKPSQLDLWQIPYTIDWCGRSELIFTTPNSYHQVINCGPNFAESVNFELLDSPDDPEGYRWCGRKCSRFGTLRKIHFQLRQNPTNRKLGERKLEAQPSQNSSKHHPPGPDEEASSRQWIEYIQTLDLYAYKFPWDTTLDSKVVRMVGAVLSRGSIRDSFEVLRLVRHNDIPLSLRTIGGLDGVELAVKLTSIVEECVRHIKFDKFLFFFTQFHLACVMDNGRGERIRVETTLVDQVLKSLGWEKDEKNRRRLKSKVAFGKKVGISMGNFLGLLNFFPTSKKTPYGMSLTKYFGSTKEDQEAFRAYMEKNKVARMLSRVGEVFQSSLITVQHGEMQWEKIEGFDFLKATEEELILKLEQLILCHGTERERTRYKQGEACYRLPQSPDESLGQVLWILHLNNHRSAALPEISQMVLLFLV